MKVRIERSETGPGVGPAPQDLEAPLVFYASDGDHVLYFHLHDEMGVRLGGGQYGAGQWVKAEETEPVSTELASKWRRMQDRATDNPEKIPT